MPRTAPRTTSGRRSASSPRNTIPTSIPATRRPKPSSRDRQANEHSLRSGEAPALRRRRDRRHGPRKCRRAATIATMRAGPAASTTMPRVTSPSSTWRYLLRDVRPAPRRRRGFSAGGFDMGGMPVTYSLRVPFLWRRARQTAGHAARRQDARHRRARGTTDGLTLRLNGQGMPGGQGRPAGDAYVEIHVDPHAFFQPRATTTSTSICRSRSRGHLGRQGEGADGGGRGDCSTCRPAKYRHVAAANGPRPARPQIGPAGDQYCKLKVVAARGARREAQAIPGRLGSRSRLRSTQGDGAVHMTTLDELLRSTVS